VIFFGFLLIVAAEVAAFAEVAARIGFFDALAVLLLVSALGPFVVRRVGFGVLAHTRQRLERGEVPTREVLDGIVVLIGGVLICIPGFVGDALGLLLMIAPVRHALIRTSGHRLSRRIQAGSMRRGRVIDVSQTSQERDRSPSHGLRSALGRRPPD
jgi:UPF0716 protein FxsA